MFKLQELYTGEWAGRISIKRTDKDLEEDSQGTISAFGCRGD